MILALDIVYLLIFHSLGGTFHSPPADTAAVREEVVVKISHISPWGGSVMGKSADQLLWVWRRQLQTDRRTDVRLPSCLKMSLIFSRKEVILRAPEECVAVIAAQHSHEGMCLF